ncbi:MAG: hypothetical protein ABI741_07775 [Ferruginibacter sp.]
MFKKLPHTLIIGCLLLFATNIKAQLFINGAQFFIESGATVTVQGDLTSNTDILGTGKILLKGAANQNINMNNTTIPNLEMDNVSNVTLTGSAKIGTNLLFTNGRIILGSNDLTMSPTATITTPGSSKFIVTNSTGKLIKASLAGTAFTYPVGNTTLTYNPVILSNTGTTDDIAVRCLANAYSTGLTGSSFTKEVVDASWDISEALAGGSNLSLTASWDGTDELPGFNRNKAGISYYITAPAASVGWDLLNTQTSIATGANPYSYVRNGITTLGAFAIGTRPVLSPLLVSPKIFLQADYVGGLMNDNLRTLDKIPPAEPYTAITNFTQSGSGGGETSTTAIVGSTAPAGNNAITDWVFVQLHDGTSGAVVSTRSALLQRDGDVVETDGVSPVNMAGNIGGNYYISIRHRNHLGVRSLNNMLLAKTTATPYNFTTAQTQAFPGVVSNNPMATLAAGVFGLWAGNANDDVVVKMTGLTANNNDYLKLINILGSSTNTIPNTYSKQDLNHDGTVKMTGLSAANNDYLKLLNVLGSSISIISQPAF